MAENRKQNNANVWVCHEMTNFAGHVVAPVSATLCCGSDALSKLRELHGKDAAMRNETTVFGVLGQEMKVLQITDELFATTGGSETACMSTTS